MKKRLIIGGIVAAILTVAMIGMSAVALAQTFSGRDGFEPDRSGVDGPPARGFFQERPRDGEGFFQRGPGGNGEHRPGPGHRGAGGEVTAVSDESLTLRNPDDETITVNVSDDTTVILVETQSEGSLSDIEVGDEVRVRGRPNDDGSVEARGIMVMPEGDHAGGRVTAVDGNTITVDNPKDGEAEIVVNESSQVRIGRDGESGSIADVTPDKFVAAFGETQEDGALVARLLMVHEGRPGKGPGGPREGHHGGEVTSVNAPNITVETRNGDEITIITDDNTEYRTRDGGDVSFEDIEVGGQVRVKGEPVEGQENTIKAEVVGIKPVQ